MTDPCGTRRASVLVTNDDGYLASGIRSLSAALGSAGLDVVVLAPERNHTAAGHGISLRSLTVTERGVDVYSCDGTPADCVRIALLCEVVPRPSLVVSGANHGANAGEDVTYSGTVAAAVEAVRLGVPALAVSQDSDGPGQGFLALQPSGFPNIGYAAAMAHRLTQRPLPAGTLVSLNLPASAMTSRAAVAPLGSRFWGSARGSLSVQRTGRVAVDQWVLPPEADLRGDTDIALLSRGQATVSLVSVKGGVSDVTESHRGWAQSIIDSVPLTTAVDVE